jgi:hypothetical protein
VLKTYAIRRRGTTGDGRQHCGESPHEAAYYWWESLPPCERQGGTFQLEMRRDTDAPWVAVNLLVDIEPVFRLVEVLT